MPTIIRNLLRVAEQKSTHDRWAYVHRSLCNGVLLLKKSVKTGMQSARFLSLTLVCSCSFGSVISSRPVSVGAGN